MNRISIALVAILLLALALWRQPAAGQGAVSHSRPGQEDLTFWINHEGLSEIDVEGQVGFGDAARLLMRRRANAEALRKLRDRFVFKSTAFETLPEQPGQHLVIAQGRVFNLLAAGGRVHRILEREAGVVERDVAGRRITFDVRPLVRLRVEISGPMRIYITGADGLGYAPPGSISRFAPLPAEQFFHARDSFEIELPAGETLVEAARGLEYEWASQRIELRKPATIRLAPRRWIDMAGRGWYSSDAHIHANYTADHHQTVTPADVLTYALAEDLHIPNMMVANSFGAFIHDREQFTGAPDKLSRPPYLIWWNEEMRNSGTYGHMCFYGLRSLVEPLYTGFNNTPHPDDYPPNYIQAKAARAQGGAVTYAHPGYSASIDNFSARELPIDLALGEVDAMDVMSNNPEEFAMENWYRLLNCGFRLAISAGTDSFTNVADHYVPGGHRVYVHTGARGPLTYGAWIAGYKAGRSFASNGPMIFLTVNGKEPGDEIALPAGRHKLRVKVEMRSAAAGRQDKLELIVNGEARPVSGEIEVDRGSWIAARVMGPWRRSVLNDTATFAHTSPVYVTVGGERARSPKDAKFWAEWIDQLIARVTARSLKDPARRDEVVALFRKAQASYAEQAKGKE
jgi:hypothetical protein